MTIRSADSRLKQIRSIKEQGYLLEALIRHYHLNTDLMRYIISYAAPGYSSQNKKTKTLINDLLSRIDENQKLKSIISKKSLKSVKTWAQKTDYFFKELRMYAPKNNAALLRETETIFTLLSISLNKILASRKKR